MIKKEKNSEQREISRGDNNTTRRNFEGWRERKKCKVEEERGQVTRQGNRLKEIISQRSERDKDNIVLKQGEREVCSDK